MGVRKTSGWRDLTRHDLSLSMPNETVNLTRSRWRYKVLAC